MTQLHRIMYICSHVNDVMNDDVTESLNQIAFCLFLNHQMVDDEVNQGRDGSSTHTGSGRENRLNNTFFFFRKIRENIGIYM